MSTLQQIGAYLGAKFKALDSRVTVVENNSSGGSGGDGRKAIVVSDVSQYICEYQMPYDGETPFTKIRATWHQGSLDTDNMIANISNYTIESNSIRFQASKCDSTYPCAIFMLWNGNTAIPLSFAYYTI